MTWFRSAIAISALFFLASTFLSSVYGQFGVAVISDTLYEDSHWFVEVVSEFGGAEMHDQHLSGGNPGAYRYMQHILPEPSTPQDLTRIEVIHLKIEVVFGIDSIAYIDYSEDIRLLNLPWPDAFVVSAPLIRHGGRYYRSTEFISVIGDTAWTSGTLNGLTEDDFVALDGSGDHPDFSTVGLMQVGYWRLHTRGFTQPPVPPGQDLIYEHASDNFTMTIHEELNPNSSPTARSDSFMYLDYFLNTPGNFDLLANDSDPEGDSIWIQEVSDPSIGSITQVATSTVTFQLDQDTIPSFPFTSFTYDITDGEYQNGAFVHVFFCTCPMECFPLFLGSSTGAANAGADPSVRSGLDSLDIELFRRLRDDFLNPDTTGLQMVDFYYHAAPELMPLLLLERQDLGLQAYRALELLQPPVQSLLDGDGTELITQQLVDSVSLFLDSLLVAVSDSLRDSLNLRLAQLCPLQDLVGLTVAEAAAGVFCDSMTTRVHDPARLGFLESIRPNPFTGATTISFLVREPSEVRISVTDLSGRPLRHLLRETVYPGESRAVDWDGKDNHGVDLPAGMYFVRLQTGTAVHVMKTFIVR